MARSARKRWEEKGIGDADASYAILNFKLKMEIIKAKKKRVKLSR